MAPAREMPLTSQQPLNHPGNGQAGGGFLASLDLGFAAAGFQSTNLRDSRS